MAISILYELLMLFKADSYFNYFPVHNSLQSLTFVNSDLPPGDKVYKTRESAPVKVTKDPYPIAKGS